MSLSIPLLRRDHVHFSLILDMLDRQTEALERGDARAVPIILLGLKYFRDYPRKVHHPIEDAIYGVLRHRMLRGVDKLFNALEEHVELHQELAVISAAARSLDGKDTAALAGFAERLRKFTARERRHIEKEEVYLYPAAVRLLTPEDWASVMASCSGDKDPVFGDATAASFDRLFAEILVRDLATRDV
ncbi:MAG: hemerythrin domain-containing protein [Proteobacteria bacterium]|nr:hemerythrin domain-containing protein [Pseudomonadota bacterium]